MINVVVLATVEKPTSKSPNSITEMAIYKGMMF